MLDHQVTNRKKGVTEIADIQALASRNINPDYQRSVSSNPYEFRRHNGVFTNMYDAAYRFGESQVFKA